MCVFFKGAAISLGLFVLRSNFKGKKRLQHKMASAIPLAQSNESNMLDRFLREGAFWFSFVSVCAAGMFTLRTYCFLW